jgi:hypothetical protein
MMYTRTTVGRKAMSFNVTRVNAGRKDNRTKNQR